MLAVMSDMAISTKTTTGHGDYGIDAPGALIAIALPGAAAIAALAAGVALGWATALVAVIAAVVLVDLAVTGTYLYATRIGKHRAWAGVLDSNAWRGDEQGLDLGCGRGAVLVALARRLPGGHVTGLDIWDRADQSGNAKATTQRNAAAEGVAGRVTVETGDIRYLPFPAGSFDVVTSSLVLHNLRSPADRSQVLADALRVLKPGGRLLVADIWNIDEYKRVLDGFGAENLAARDFGCRACFGVPRLRLRLISASKQRAGSAAIEAAGKTTAGSPMTERVPGGPDAGDRDRGFDDGDMHVVEDGKPDAPALLLLSNAATPAAIWDPVVPLLAGAHRVIRVDLLGHGGSARSVGSYDIPAQARRVGAALDRLGVSRVTLIGHSSGCTVATALAEQRPGAVTALALIDMGPSLDAKIPERPLMRLLLTQFPGRLLWRLKTEATIRKGARDSFTRPVDIPDAFTEHMQGITHRDFVGAMRGPLDYLGQRSLPDRLTPLGLPLLVIFGADDQRWRSSSAVAYRAVPGARVELLPGVGHTPMMEDPQATGTLLLEFAAAAGHPRRRRP
jgi:pimeloyl-ACP methyl ester carboxylesterase/ubiquinone/menaquinone biosynthesis C-methylase UbiE